jgi:hypothetical protein
MLRATWAGCGEGEDTVTGNETVPPAVVVRCAEPSTIERPVCVFVGDVLEVAELEEEDDEVATVDVVCVVDGDVLEVAELEEEDDVATVDVVCVVDDVELVEEVVEEDVVVMICW